MHLVDDKHAVFSLRRRIGNLLNDAADVIHAVVAGCIHLHDIQIRILRNRAAGGTLAARVSVCRVLTVHRLGKNLGNCRFAGPTGSAEQIAVADPAGIDLVFQSSDDRITTADILECLRPVFAIQCQIMCIRHAVIPY